MRDFAPTPFQDFRVIIIIIIIIIIILLLLFKPASYLLTKTSLSDDFSLNVYKFAVGVHEHQAIISYLPQVTTIDRGALPW